MPDPEPEIPLSSLLRSIVEQEDFDTAHCIAGAMNLYYDTIRKRSNRTVIGPEDVFRLLNIIRMYLAASDIEQGMARIAGAPTKRRQTEDTVNG